MENEEKKTYKYDAFISYRHSMPDKEVAEKLQKKLERFRLPSSVARRIGRKKLNRVFRDEAELSVSEELSRSIEEALLDSEFLIVICSPRLPQSEWCLKEIDTFLKIRGKKNILLVLIEGTPDESFPEILLYEDVVTTDTSGNEVTVRQRKEPLAANCTVTSKHVRNDTIKTTTLRLCASLFGVSYDDLKRRQRIQTIRRNVGIGAIVFLALSVFLIQTLIFVNTLNEKNKIIADKLADSTANASKSLYKEGLKKDAVYAARSVLPDHNDGSFSNNALRALINAEGIYATPGSFIPSDNYQLPSVPNNTKFSPDGRFFMTEFSDNTYSIYETESGNIICSKKTESFIKDNFVFDNKCCYMSSNKSKTYYSSIDSSSETIIEENPNTLYSTPDGQYILGFSENGFFIFSNGAIHFQYKYKDGENNFTSLYPWFCTFSNDNQYCCISFMTSNYSSTFRVICLDLSKGKIDYNDLIEKPISSQYYDGKKLYILSSEEKENENNTYISTIIPSDNTDEKTITIKGNAYTNMHFLDNYIMVSNYRNVLILDSSFHTISSSGITSFIFKVITRDDSFLFLTTDSKLYQWNKETKNLDLLSDIEFGYDPLELSLVNKTLYFSSYTQSYITTYVEADSEYIKECTGNEDLAEWDAVYYEYEEQTLILNELEKRYGSDIFYFVPSNDKKYFAIKSSNKKITICRSSDYSYAGHFYVDNDYNYNDFIFDQNSGCYMLFGQDVCILDQNFHHIATINGLQLYGKRASDQSIILCDNYFKNYTLTLASYDEIIAKADSILGDYKPDESIIEQYGLGEDLED